jgi:hypothetical protein
MTVISRTDPVGHVVNEAPRSTYLDPERAKQTLMAVYDRFTKGVETADVLSALSASLHTTSSPSLQLVQACAGQNPKRV